MGTYGAFLHCLGWCLQHCVIEVTPGSFCFPTWMSSLSLLSYSKVVALLICSFSNDWNVISFQQYFPEAYQASVATCSVESRLSPGFRDSTFREIMMAPWQHWALTVSEGLTLSIRLRRQLWHSSKHCIHNVFLGVSLPNISSFLPSVRKLKLRQCWVPHCWLLKGRSSTELGGCCMWACSCGVWEEWGRNGDPISACLEKKHQTSLLLSKHSLCCGAAFYGE